MSRLELGQDEKAVHLEGQSRHTILMSIPEAARSLRLSRAKVYQLIALEGLPVVRFGRAVRVSRSSLECWVQRRELGV
jgi:excisionase family DNA binding protein